MAHAVDDIRFLLGWRPFLGGDEDRNALAVYAADTLNTWRPFLGGDEDRNSDLPIAMCAHCS